MPMRIEDDKHPVRSCDVGIPRLGVSAMRKHRSNRRGSPIFIEALEDRWLPATYLPAPADYDGDHHADLGALRVNSDPAAAGTNGLASYLTDQTSGGAVGALLGYGLFNGVQSQDTPAPGEYNRNGKEDLAVFGPYGPNGGGRFLYLPSSGDVSKPVEFDIGNSLDVAAVGTFDGAGGTDFGVFGPYGPNGSGRFLFFNSRTNSFQTVNLGGPNDVPAVADYDGLGKDDFAVYGPDGKGGMRLEYLPSNGGDPVTIELGNSHDVPAPGNYDVDDKSDPAVYGPDGTGGMRLLYLPAHGGPAVSVEVGSPGDLPAPADYNGDGKTEPAAFTPGTAVFHIVEPGLGVVNRPLNPNVIPVERPDPQITLSQPLNPPYATPLAAHDNFKGRTGSPNVVFFGDSITDFWGETAGPGYPARSPATNPADVGYPVWSGRISTDFGLAYNFGLGSDSSQNVLWRVENGEIGGSIQPKVVVLMVGINDLKFYDETPQDVATTIQAIVAAIHARTAGTKVLVMDLLPSGQPNDSLRAEINQLNQLISGNANQSGIAPLYKPGTTTGNLAGDYSLNIDAQFLNPDGTINTALIQYSDGVLLHPTEQGYQVWASAISTPIQKMLGRVDVPNDFEGDGVSDLSNYQISTGLWTIKDPLTGNIVRVMTKPGMVPVPADYDGDGITDLALFDPTAPTPVYYIWNSNNSPISAATPLSHAFLWGTHTMIPVPADYDGDGKADFAGFDPFGAQPTYYIAYSSGHAPPGLPGPIFAWGNTTIQPLPGDYNGDGRADVAGFEPGGGTAAYPAAYYFSFSSGGTQVVPWGNTTIRSAPGDYFGDGHVDLAGYDPNSTPSTFYIHELGGPTRVLSGYGGGNASLLPVAGEYVAAGTTDVATFAPSDGWFVSSSNNLAFSLPADLVGGSSDLSDHVPIGTTPTVAVSLAQHKKPPGE
jgi:lysophospholipase L1-like esterase